MSNFFDYGHFGKPHMKQAVKDAVSGLVDKISVPEAYFQNEQRRQGANVLYENTKQRWENGGLRVGSPSPDEYWNEVIQAENATTESLNNMMLAQVRTPKVDTGPILA